MPGRAYVLHLARADKRRANAHDLLETCGLAGGIWPAIDGATMSSTDLSSTIGARLFDPPYPFALKTGEIGCFLSHRQIWAEIIRRNEGPGFIIEDDAAIDPEPFAQALVLAWANIDNLGYIQFQTRATQGPTTLIDKSGAAALVVPQRVGLRSTAQMVSPRAAARLLSLSEVIDRPVDTFVQSHWYTGLRPGMIYPSGISEIADRLDGSTIQGGRKSLLEKLGREFARTQYRSRVKRLSCSSLAPKGGGIDD